MKKDIFVDDFRVVKRKAIKAAKDLGYGKDVIEKVKAAKNEGEINSAMTTARKALL